MSLTLHGYWRSGASHRVRIALGLKGLSWTDATHDLRKGEQRAPDFLALNPQGMLPALETGEATLIQSPAILEWIEEAHPNPPLLPQGLADRARVRGMAAMIACDIHPLNNLRVQKSLREDLQADEAQVSAWIARWITQGFTALEILIARHGGEWCFGDEPTLADCTLIPQIYGAQRFRVDLEPFPLIRAINTRAAGHPAFAAAHPDRQPDADA